MGTRGEGRRSLCARSAAMQMCHYVTWPFPVSNFQRVHTPSPPISPLSADIPPSTPYSLQSHWHTSASYIHIYLVHFIFRLVPLCYRPSHLESPVHSDVRTYGATCISLDEGCLTCFHPICIDPFRAIHALYIPPI